jgi:hypothetical protein
MMMIADGVNMPFTNVARSLLVLAIPFAIASILSIAMLNRHECSTYVPEPVSWAAAARGLIPMVVIVAIWVIARVFGTVVVDPASPLILVIGGLVTLPFVARKDFRDLLVATFTGTPLLLAAALVSIGMLIQVFTLTGVRGWLVVTIMSLEAPWNYVSVLLGLPIVGGVLSSLGNSAILAVPIAFSFIHQNMIINAAALSAISAIAEFVVPTAVSAALSCYVVGGGVTEGQVFRRAWPALVVLAVIATLMLMFATHLVPYLVD